MTVQEIFWNTVTNKLLKFAMSQVTYLMQFSWAPPRGLEGSTASLLIPGFDWPYNFPNASENWEQGSQYWTNSCCRGHEQLNIGTWNLWHSILMKLKIIGPVNWKLEIVLGRRVWILSHVQWRELFTLLWKRGHMECMGHLPKIWSDVYMRTWNTLLLDIYGDFLFLHVHFIALDWVVSNFWWGWLLVGRKPISLLYIVGIESLIDMLCLLFLGLLERAQEDPNSKTYTSTKRKHKSISQK